MAILLVILCIIAVDFACVALCLSNENNDDDKKDDNLEVRK